MAGTRARVDTTLDADGAKRIEILIKRRGVRVRVSVYTWRAIYVEEGDKIYDQRVLQTRSKRRAMFVHLNRIKSTATATAIIYIGVCVFFFIN